MTAFVDRLAERRFRVLFQLAQDERGDLRRREGLVAQLELDHRFAAVGDVEREELQLFLDIGDAAAHQPLDGIDRALRMRRSASRALALPTMTSPLWASETTLGTACRRRRQE